MRATPADALRLGAVIRIGGREWALAGFAKVDNAPFSGDLEPKYPDFAECFSCLRSLAEAKEVDVEVLFHYKLDKPEPPSVPREVLVGEQLIEIGIGGSPILRWCESGGWASINLAHPALISWNAAVDLKWLAQRYKAVGEDICAHIDGWFSLALCSNPVSSLMTNALQQLEITFGLPQSAEDWRRESDAAESFLNMFNGLFPACLRVIRDTLRVSLT